MELVGLKTRGRWTRGHMFGQSKQFAQQRVRTLLRKYSFAERASTLNRCFAALEAEVQESQVSEHADKEIHGKLGVCWPQEPSSDLHEVRLDASFSYPWVLVDRLQFSPEAWHVISCEAVLACASRASLESVEFACR